MVPWPKSDNPHGILCIRFWFFLWSLPACLKEPLTRTPMQGFPVMPLNSGSLVNQCVDHFWAPPAYLALCWKLEDVGQGIGPRVCPQGLTFL